MNTIIEEQIMKILEQKHTVSVQELSERLYISKMTVRRYLQSMQEEHLVTRFHGGAMLPGITPGVSNPESDYSFQNAETKRAVGKKGSEFLKKICQTEKISSLALLSGNTVLSMIKQIDYPISATITTDSVASAYALCNAHVNENLIMLGGKISQPDMNVYGFLADQALTFLSFDYCFTGIAGISKSGDLYCYEYNLAAVISRIFASSRHIVILADHSKFDRSRLVRICTVDSRFTLITDEAAPEKELLHLKEKGVLVL